MNIEDLSKHRVGVRGSLRNTLKDIPVLHDLTVRVEPKNVDTGPTIVAGPFLKTMQHDPRRHSQRRRCGSAAVLVDRRPTLASRTVLSAILAHQVFEELP